MPNIVAIGTGEKGCLLLQKWRNTGRHQTGHGVEHLADAAVVLLDMVGLDVDVAQFAPQLAGKIVIDCGNPSAITELRSQRSSAEEFARLCPGARIVKALNVIDCEALRFVFDQIGPSIDGIYTSVYQCGDDPEAKFVVSALLEEIALDPIDCGPLSNAILLESLGLLSVYLAAEVIRPPFAMVVARKPTDRSPLDRWM